MSNLVQEDFTTRIARVVNTLPTAQRTVVISSLELPYRPYMTAVLKHERALMKRRPRAEWPATDAQFAEWFYACAAKAVKIAHEKAPEA